MPLPAGVMLRPARAEDAEAGARLHRACWREAYGPITDPALLAARLGDGTDWADRWRTQVESGPEWVLAVAGDELVGFGIAGASRHDQAPAGDELYALYVRSVWYGTGLGAALLERVLGDRPAYLWVLEDNARARAFYARQGFVADGVRQRYEPLGASEVRMVRR